MSLLTFFDFYDDLNKTFKQKFHYSSPDKKGTMRFYEWPDANVNLDFMYKPKSDCFDNNFTVPIHLKFPDGIKESFHELLRNGIPEDIATSPKYKVEQDLVLLVQTLLRRVDVVYSLDDTMQFILNKDLLRKNKNIDWIIILNDMAEYLDESHELYSKSFIPSPRGKRMRANLGYQYRRTFYQPLLQDLKDKESDTENNKYLLFGDLLLIKLIICFVLEVNMVCKHAKYFKDGTTDYYWSIICPNFKKLDHKYERPTLFVFEENYLDEKDVVTKRIFSFHNPNQAMRQRLAFYMSDKVKVGKSRAMWCKNMSYTSVGHRNEKKFFEDSQKSFADFRTWKNLHQKYGGILKFNLGGKSYDLLGHPDNVPYTTVKNFSTVTMTADEQKKNKNLFAALLMNLSETSKEKFQRLFMNEDGANGVLLFKCIYEATRVIKSGNGIVCHSETDDDIIESIPKKACASKANNDSENSADSEECEEVVNLMKELEEKQAEENLSKEKNNKLKKDLEKLRNDINQLGLHEESLLSDINKKNKLKKRTNASLKNKIKANEMLKTDLEELTQKIKNSDTKVEEEKAKLDNIKKEISDDTEKLAEHQRSIANSKVKAEKSVNEYQKNLTLLVGMSKVILELTSHIKNVKEKKKKEKEEAERVKKIVEDAERRVEEERKREEEMRKKEEADKAAKAREEILRQEQQSQMSECQGKDSKGGKESDSGELPFAKETGEGKAKGKPKNDLGDDQSSDDDSVEVVEPPSKKDDDSVEVMEPKKKDDDSVVVVQPRDEIEKIRLMYPDAFRRYVEDKYLDRSNDIQHFRARKYQYKWSENAPKAWYCFLNAICMMDRRDFDGVVDEFHGLINSHLYRFEDDRANAIQRFITAANAIPALKKYNITNDYVFDKRNQKIQKKRIVNGKEQKWFQLADPTTTYHYLPRCVLYHPDDKLFDGYATVGTEVFFPDEEKTMSVHDPKAINRMRENRPYKIYALKTKPDPLNGWKRKQDDFFIEKRRKKNRWY